MDEGVLRRGHGFTRDISPKGMFIYSDIKPPEKADLRVEVSFRDLTSTPTNMQMSAKGLVIRLEPATNSGSQQGFAILNRSLELHDGVNPVYD
jgi:PilZ domain